MSDRVQPVRDRPSAATRGFALAELLAIVVLVTISLLFFLRVVDRKTRVGPDAGDGTDLRASVKRAGDLFARDLRNAAAGPLPLVDAVRPLRDNAMDGSVRGLDGKPVAVRVGTDQVELRGVLESSLLRLDASDPKTGQAFSAPGTSASRGLFQRSPADATLRIAVYPGRENPRRLWMRKGVESVGLERTWPPSMSFGRTGGLVSEPLRGMLAALRDRGGRSRKEKAFFLVSDEDGAYAVARILSADDRQLSTGCDCAAPVEYPGACPPVAGCSASLRLDFTDADAVALNRGSDTEALSRLGAIAFGGLFDRVIFFVARGDEGAPPDFVPASDPPSVRFPHPYFAAARDVGGARFEVSRIADDIEDFQVSYLTDPADGATAPDISAGAGAWADPFGRSRLSGVRIGLVAKAKERMQPGEAFAGADGRAVSLEGRDGVWLLNAPRAEHDPAIPGPVGWSADPSKRVPFVRRFELIDVAISEAR